MDESTTTLAPDDPSWMRFVESSPEATPFHHPAWLSLLADTYRLRAFVVARRDADGRIVAGAPLVAVDRGHRWVSLAFTDFCGTLGSAEARRGLLEALDNERKEQGVRSIEIREAGQGTATATPVGFRHQLALGADPAEILTRFDRSQVQRGIKKAERERVEVRLGSGREDLDIFYSLHLATRRRLGVPIQPRAFFDGLWDRLIDPGLGAILVAEIDERPVAAAIFLGWRDMVIYKFGASDRAAWSHRPNHALFWSAICWACERGFSLLDFGRTDLDNEGLRAFKAGWGTVETPLVYSTLGEQRAVHAGGTFSRALRAVIRHSPELVCQKLGEHIYRYAA